MCKKCAQQDGKSVFSYSHLPQCSFMQIQQMYLKEDNPHVTHSHSTRLFTYLSTSKNALLNLLSRSLYPLSTVPITITTTYIKNNRKEYSL